jgi:hypothetical protein
MWMTTFYHVPYVTKIYLAHLGRGKIIFKQQPWGKKTEDSTFHYFCLLFEILKRQFLKDLLFVQLSLAEMGKLL